MPGGKWVPASGGPAAGSGPSDCGVVASGEALSIAQQLLGVRSLKDVVPPEQDEPPARPQGLGLGARFLPHSKAGARRARAHVPARRAIICRTAGASDRLVPRCRRWRWRGRWRRSSRGACRSGATRTPLHSPRLPTARRRPAERSAPSRALQAEPCSPHSLRPVTGRPWSQLSQCAAAQAPLPRTRAAARTKAVRAPLRTGQRGARPSGSLSGVNQALRPTARRRGGKATPALRVRHSLRCVCLPPVLPLYAVQMRAASCEALHAVCMTSVPQLGDHTASAV